ncbi:Bug family tripartite tricarboxylate transporter substrate binding protein [Humitalea sp. 24SJ18S-53]|uniref:Bug family tripartite tricarboxylate transporter substrate binding protein n=1 Tax=Humitalea sp. 24SJ18S-53 TaxID=3422307 RepID=UPI003D66DCCF
MPAITRRLALASVLGLPSLLQPAHAQAPGYPNRPIRLVVPFPPGGSTDTAARLIAEYLGQRLGQSIVVENRGGAGGVVGTDAVVKSPPDGHTLVFGTVSSTAINHPLFGSRMPYRADELAGIGLVLSAPNLILVRHDSRFRTLRDLVTFAKANPGVLNFGTTGPGSSVQMAGALLQLAAGIEVTAIPYRGGAQVLQELLAGRVDFIVDSIPSAITLIQDGQLRVLAVTDLVRASVLPDAPTTTEEGFPDVQSTAWFGLLAPAQTPRPIIERLGRDLAAVLEEPGVQARFASLGGGPLPLPGGRTTPAAFDAFIAAEIAKWSGVVERTGVTAN